MLHAPEWRIVAVIGTLPASLALMLNKQGWMPQETKDLREVYARAKVGIINAAQLQFSLDALDKVLYQHSDTKWLCLVDKDQLQNKALRNIVCRHCDDFMTLPLDEEWLSYSLGHLWGMQSLKGDEKEKFDTELYPSFLPEGCTVSSKIHSNLKKIAQGDANVFVTAHEGSCFNDIIAFIHDTSWRRNAEVLRLNAKSVNATTLDNQLSRIEQHGLNATIVFEDASQLKPDVVTTLKRYLSKKKGESLTECRPCIRFILTSSFCSDERVDGDLLQALSPAIFRMPTLETFQSSKQSVIEKKLEIVAKRLMQKPPKLSSHTTTLLNNYSWPGDYEELEKTLIHLTLQGEKKLDELLGFNAEKSPGSVTISELRDQNECSVVLSAIRDAKGSVERSCEILNVSRASVYRLIKKHGLTDELNKVRQKTSA